MQKFTIFTVVLAVAVVTVIADLSVREYMTDETGKSSVLQDEPAKPVVETPKQPAEVLKPKVVVAPEPSPLTSELILEAGLGEEVKAEQFGGKVYKLLDITSTPVTDISYYEMFVENIPVASVSEIALPDEIRALQLYKALQNKTKTFIDLSLNETNAYADNSFYVNHVKKSDEAFLTVRIGKRLYSFAYLKIYHTEIKKLIQLLNP